jgi:hypothetical protein
MRLLLAVTAALAITGSAAAQSAMPPEDAVAFLMVGITDGGPTELGGIPFSWKRTSADPGKFVGEGANAEHSVRVQMDVSKVAECTFRVDTHVTADKETWQAWVQYDFSKITGMTLIDEDSATIAGADFCTTSEPDMCGDEVLLSTPTDADTFNSIYSGLRAAACP